MRAAWREDRSRSARALARMSGASNSVAYQVWVELHGRAGEATSPAA